FKVLTDSANLRQHWLQIKEQLIRVCLNKLEGDLPEQNQQIFVLNKNLLNLYSLFKDILALESLNVDNDESVLIFLSALKKLAQNSNLVSSLKSIVENFNSISPDRQQRVLKELVSSSGDLINLMRLSQAEIDFIRIVKTFDSGLSSKI